MPATLITGCSSGFGLLAAVEFARNGHRVFATMRDPGKAGPLEAAAAAAEGSVEVLPLDVTDDASVRCAVAEAVERAGRLDVVVNNAGIEMFGAVHLATDAEVLRQLDTNVLGVVRVARAVVPHLIEQGGGVIVNVGSISGLVGVPYSGLYAASKHAVEAITEAMHFELAVHRVHVRVVEPGQFATSLGDNSVVVAGMPEGSADFERWQRFRTATRGLVGGSPADPAAVASAIYQAATEEPGRLRYLVGGDAELIAGTKAAMSFEEFEATMRTALGWWD